MCITGRDCRTTVINSMLSHIQQLYNHSAVHLNSTLTGAEFGWLTARTVLTVSHLASFNGCTIFSNISKYSSNTTSC